MIETNSGPGSNAQLRKIKKPLIERRRRERINDCLGQLKSLVLEAMNRDESCYSKMEKADILEMTVAHLRSVQRRPTSPASAAVSSSSSSSQEEAQKKYLLGFNECAKEVGNYLSTVEELAVKVGGPLMKHLVICLENFRRSVVSVAPKDGAPNLYDLKPFDQDTSMYVLPSTRSTIPDFSDSTPLVLGTVALNLDSFHTLLPYRDFKSYLSLPSSSSSSSSDVSSDSLISDVTESSLLGNSLGPVSSSAFKNLEQNHGVVSLRSTSFSEDSRLFSPVCTFELLDLKRSSNASRVLIEHTGYPLVLPCQNGPLASDHFLSSQGPPIPSLSALDRNIEQPIKRETVPSSSVWRPW